MHLRYVDTFFLTWPVAVKKREEGTHLGICFVFLLLLSLLTVMDAEEKGIIHEVELRQELERERGKRKHIRDTFSDSQVFGGSFHHPPHVSPTLSTPPATSH
jgi:hypothetical protein